MKTQSTARAMTALVFAASGFAIVGMALPKSSTVEFESAYRASGRFELAHRASGRFEIANRGSGRLTQLLAHRASGRFNA